jgi:hypothetical protein
MDCEHLYQDLISTVNGTSDHTLWTLYRSYYIRTKISLFLLLSHSYHVVMNIQELFSWPATCLTSTANDCKCSRDQPLRSTLELVIINFGHPSYDWPLRTLVRVDYGRQGEVLFSFSVLDTTQDKDRKYYIQNHWSMLRNRDWLE